MIKGKIRVSFMFFLICIILFGFQIHSYSEDLTSDTAILNKISLIMHPYVKDYFLPSSDVFVGAFYLNKRVESDQNNLDEILNYARENEHNFKVCYDYAFNILENYNKRFGINGELTEKDKEYLNISSGIIKDKHYEVKTIDERVYCDKSPSTGLEIAVYLLLELCIEKNDNVIMKKTTVCIYNTYISSCYLDMRKKQLLYKYNINKTQDDIRLSKNVDNAIEMIKLYNRNTKFGDVGFYTFADDLSCAVSYYSDLFLEKMALKKDSCLSKNTKSIAAAFYNWKSDYDIERLSKKNKLKHEECQGIDCIKMEEVRSMVTKRYPHNFYSHRPASSHLFVMEYMMIFINSL